MKDFIFSLCVIFLNYICHKYRWGQEQNQEWQTETGLLIREVRELGRRLMENQAGPQG